MEEVIKQILEAEKEAERRVQDARTKAAEIRSKADSQSDGKIQKAREQAQQRMQDAISKARKEAEQERREALRKIEEENKHFLEEQRKGIERTAQKIVELVIEPEYRKG